MSRTFGSKLWIVAELERLDPMRLQFVLFPDSLNRGGTDLLCRSHRANAPVGGIFRHCFHRGLHDGGFLVSGNPLRPSAAREIFENPVQALTLISLPPQQHRRHRSRSASWPGPDWPSLSRTQNDVDPQNDASWRTALPTDRHQLLPLRIRQVKCRCTREWHIHVQYAVAFSISKAISDSVD